MTCEPAGWIEPGRQAWRWPGGGAAGGLALAAESIAGAAQGLAAADDVDWVSVAATRYRAVLAEAAAGLRAARSLLDDAAAAVAAHDAAVAQAEWARGSAPW